LGHILQDGQRLPAPGKLTAIEKWEIPKTVKEVRAFLGLCQYYAQYIPNFAGIATALTDSLAEDKLKGQKGVNSKRVHKFIPTGPISLTEQAVKSFYDLRQAMLDFVVLKLIDLDQDFILHTDASDFAVGGCLSQKDEEGNLRPVALYSRKLTGKTTAGIGTLGQRKWSVREKETYAAVACLRKWEP